MAIFSSTQPSLRARILPRFPAQVLAGTGISIVKSGGTYTFAAVLSGAASLVVVDKGTVSSGTVTFLASDGGKQKLTVGGALSIAFSGWPASGNYGEVEIELVNGGTNVTWPTVRWLKGDGTNNIAFSSMGVTLNAAGTNFAIVWTTDGGVTLYGRAA